MKLAAALLVPTILNLVLLSSETIAQPPLAHSDDCNVQ